MSSLDRIPRPLLVLLALLGGCRHGEPSPSGHEHPHWAYEGAEGPVEWGHLSPEFAACSEGKHQSPIDLGTAARAELPALALDYHPTPLSLINNGHTIEDEVEPGNALMLEGQRYELKQFHLHAPSEHAVNGVHFPMELHLVHKGPDGALAVVGIFLADGAKNTALAPVFDGMAPDAGEAVSGSTVDLATVVPADRKYSRYEGSLTTPPCSENVHWLVMAASSEVSHEQLAAFTALYPHNSRPLMPVNDRKVVSASAP